MTSDFPPTGPRLVRATEDGLGQIYFGGSVIADSRLAAYVGEKVHVHDGYGENWVVSEWADPPFVRHNGIKSRAGSAVVQLELVDARGTRWRRTPCGGRTRVDGKEFVAEAPFRGDSDYGSFS